MSSATIRRLTRPRTRSVPGLALALALAACGEFPHTNPVDPATPFQVTITGPDTIRSLGGEVTFTASTSLPWTGPAPTWSGGGGLVSLGGGRFRVANSGSATFTGRVEVAFGLHEAAVREVVVMQVPARIVIADFCGNVVDGVPRPLPPWESCVNTLVAIGSMAFLSVGVQDSLGAQYWGNAARTVFARDPSIVEVNAGRMELRGLKAGTTWVVVRAGPAADSIRVAVRQVPAGATVAGPCSFPADPRPLAVGDTGRVRLTGVTDIAGEPIPGAASPQVSWRPSTMGAARVDVQPDGFFRIVSAEPGWIQFAWLYARDSSGYDWAMCGIAIRP